MGNFNLCCNYDRNTNKNEKKPSRNNDLNLSYDNNLIEQQFNDSKTNPVFEQDLNESSIIGIADFNSTSYINVNLQVFSRLKYFIDFLDIKMKMNGNIKEIKNLKFIFNNLFKGFPCNSEIKNFISEIGHLDIDSDSKIKVGNDALNFHEFMLDYINNLCYKDKHLMKDYFINENNQLSQREIFKLKEDFRLSFENEIKEMFFLGVISSFNSSSCENCQLILNKYETTSFSHINLSSFENQETIQNNIENLFYETKMIQIKCNKCSTINNVKEAMQILNFPKYLLIKLKLIDGLELDKIMEIKLRKKLYTLANIIFTQDREENLKEYSISTKISNSWFYCDNNNNVSILRDYSLNNSYLLYYTRQESTL